MSQADKTVRRELVTSPDTQRTGYLKVTSISPLLGAPINTVAPEPVKKAGFEGWMATALLKVTPQCANWCSTTSKHFKSSKATRTIAGTLARDRTSDPAPERSGMATKDFLPFKSMLRQAVSNSANPSD